MDTQPSPLIKTKWPQKAKPKSPNLPKNFDSIADYQEYISQVQDNPPERTASDRKALYVESRPKSVESYFDEELDWRDKRENNNMSEKYRSESAESVGFESIIAPKVEGEDDPWKKVEENSARSRPRNFPQSPEQNYPRGGSLDRRHERNFPDRNGPAGYSHSSEWCFPSSRDSSERNILRLAGHSHGSERNISTQQNGDVNSEPLIPYHSKSRPAKGQYCTDDLDCAKRSPKRKSSLKKKIFADCTTHVKHTMCLSGHSPESPEEAYRLEEHFSDYKKYVPYNDIRRYKQSVKKNMYLDYQRKLQTTVWETQGFKHNCVRPDVNTFVPPDTPRTPEPLKETTFIHSEVITHPYIPGQETVVKPRTPKPPTPWTPKKVSILKETVLEDRPPPKHAIEKETVLHNFQSSREDLLRQDRVLPKETMRGINAIRYHQAGQDLYTHLPGRKHLDKPVTSSISKTARSPIKSPIKSPMKSPVTKEDNGDNSKQDSGQVCRFYIKKKSDAKSEVCCRNGSIKGRGQEQGQGQTEDDGLQPLTWPRRHKVRSEVSII